MRRNFEDRSQAERYAISKDVIESIEESFGHEGCSQAFKAKEAGRQQIKFTSFGQLKKAA